MSHPAARVGRHESAPPVTIGTHRLWISLWTHLGQCEDNTARPGGNRQASSGERTALHSRPPAGYCSRTGPVVTQCHPGLGDSRLSPGSTDPTTTTNSFITKTQAEVAGGRTGGRVKGREARRGNRTLWRGPTQATGGSFG